MAPAPQYCAEKKRLLDTYLAASHEVLTLQDQETAEILKGGDMDRFDLALEAARHGSRGTQQRQYAWSISLGMGADGVEHTSD